MRPSTAGAGGRPARPSTPQRPSALPSFRPFNNAVGQRPQTAMVDTSQAVKSVIRKLNRGFPFQEIKLSSRSLDDAQVQSLCIALRGNTCVQSLLLDRNPCITATGVAALVAFLGRNPMLTKLDLAGTRILSQGGASLAQALRVNRKLQYLCLDNTKLGDSGAISLAQALEDNDTLLHLTLWSNAITAKGARALAAMLKSNRSLLDVSLGSNPIKNTHDGVQVLADIQKYLDRNHVEAVLDMVRECTDLFYDTIQVIDGYLHAAPAY